MQNCAVGEKVHFEKMTFVGRSERRKFWSEICVGGFGAETYIRRSYFCIRQKDSLYNLRGLISTCILGKYFLCKYFYIFLVDIYTVFLDTEFV